MLVALFAGVALVITAAGIAGVVSFSVNQRTTEIGVRMALGAPRASVTQMIVRAWNKDQPGDAATLDGKRRALERFGNDVLAGLR